MIRFLLQGCNIEIALKALSMYIADVTRNSVDADPNAVSEPTLFVSVYSWKASQMKDRDPSVLINNYLAEFIFLN